jgi:cystathionine beta-lyase
VYNFDKIINRRNTNCAKWDTLAAMYGRNDLIHLGVADMDFESPKPILDAFSKVVDHKIFGYTDLNDGFYSSIQRWINKQLGVNIPREWIVFCPRINIASSICVDTLTSPSSSVILNSPAYSPLKEAIVKNNRRLIENSLVIKNGKFTMDFDHLESIVDDDTEMFILCNPDNPSGRVWSRKELEQLVQFCKEKDLILFSDEIHSDLLAEGVKHNSALHFEELYDRLIYANSPTKTFNIPGVIISYMIIPNEELRDKVKKSIDRIGMHNPNIFSVVAVEAAYNHCDDWLMSVKDYVNENEKFVRSFLEENMKEFVVMPREGTYLLWIDYTALGVSEDELRDWFINEAKVELYMATNFGKDGYGYIRMNIAAPRKLLEEALNNMKNVYHKIKHK